LYKLGRLGAGLLAGVVGLLEFESEHSVTRTARREHEASAPITATSHVAAEVSVEPGLNDIRLAVLGIIVTIGLTVGFAVTDCWWVGLAAGIGSLSLVPSSVGRAPGTCS
jgi:hypothetical protein